MGSAYPLILSENYRRAQRIFAALLECNDQPDVTAADLHQLAAQRSLYRLGRSEISMLSRWLGWQLVTQSRMAQRSGMHLLARVSGRLESAVELEITRLPMAAIPFAAVPMRLSA